MKKALLKLFVLVLALCLAVCSFAACGDGNGNNTGNNGGNNGGVSGDVNGGNQGGNNQGSGNNQTGNNGGSGNQTGNNPGNNGGNQGGSVINPDQPGNPGGNVGGNTGDQGGSVINPGQPGNPGGSTGGNTGNVDATIGNKLSSIFDSFLAIEGNNGIVIDLGGDAMIDEDMAISYYNYDLELQSVQARISGTVDGELFIGLGEDGLPIIKGAVLVEAVAKVDGSEFATEKFEAYIATEGDTVYLKYLIDDKFADSADVSSINNYTESDTYSINAEQFLEMILGDVSIEELNESLDALMQLIEQNSDFINGEILPLIERISGDVAGTVKNLVNANLNSMFSISNDGREVYYDFDKIKEISNDLYNLSIKNYMDKYLGAGTFESFKQGVLNTLDLTLGDMLWYVFTSDGLTIAELEAKINEIGKLYNSEFDLATLLGIPSGSIEDLINSQEMQALLDMTLLDLFTKNVVQPEYSVPDGYYQENSGYSSEPGVSVGGSAGSVPGYPGDTSVDYKAMLAQYIDQAGEMNYFDTLLPLLDLGDVEAMKPVIKEATDGVLDILSEIYSFKAVFSDIGKFEKLEFVTDFNGASVGAKIKELVQGDGAIPATSSSVNDGQTEVNTASAIIEKTNFNITTTISIGQFTNKLNVNYNEIIEEVKNDPKQRIAGTYKIYSRTEDGETIVVGTPEAEAKGFFPETEEIELNKSGSLIIKTNYDSYRIYGSWFYDGENLILEYYDGYYEYKVSGDEISCTNDELGLSVVYKKA